MTGRPQLSACELLRYMAVKTGYDIDAEGSTGIRIGEESLTDSLLLDLARWFPHPTRVVKWNRFEEARDTGADWDWWFVDSHRGFGVGLRIQAKRIDYYNERFPGFDHRNQHGRQVEMLNRSAASAGLHPLYCLYLASFEPPRGSSCCEVFAAGGPFLDMTADSFEAYGCSLVGVPVIGRAIDEREDGLRPLWPYLLPWSCLVCCDKFGNDLIEQVDSQAYRIGRVLAWGERDDLHPPASDSLITDEFPPEVGLLLEGEPIGGSVRVPGVGATALTLVNPDAP